MDASYKLFRLFILIKERLRVRILVLSVILIFMVVVLMMVSLVMMVMILGLTVPIVLLLKLGSTTLLIDMLTVFLAKSHRNFRSKPLILIIQMLIHSLLLLRRCGDLLCYLLCLTICPIK